jgi:DNA-binding PucR family transcriptional regulator
VAIVSTDTDFATALKANADAHAAAVAHRIHEQVLDFGDRAAVTQQTTDAVRSLITAFARKLLRHPPDDRFEVPAEAIEYVRAFVHRGFDLELLLRVYRLGHRELWALSVDILEASGQGAEQREISEALFDFMDVLTQRVVEEYQAERERWIRSSHALRTQIVRNIVSGRPIAVDDASARLRYDLSGLHVGLVAWTEEESGVDSDDGAPGRHVKALAAKLERSSIVISVGRRTAYAWIAQREEGEQELTELLADHDCREGVSVAVGEPGRGLEGFRNSHLDAVASRRVAVIAGMHSGATMRWSDVATLGLLSADIGHARRFTSQELGPLDADDDAAARLRATLIVYLQENDRQRTAQRLGIHPNTVAYRLRQCEELLNRPVKEGRFKLEAALRLRDLMQLSLAVPTRQPPGGPWSDLHDGHHEPDPAQLRPADPGRRGGSTSH